MDRGWEELCLLLQPAGHLGSSSACEGQDHAELAELVVQALREALEVDRQVDCQDHHD